MVLEVARAFVGTRATVRQWYVRTDTYVVASVASFVVKLEIPGRRPNRRFDAMAVLAQKARHETPVPTFDVVAVDVSRQRWPWNVLIVTELPGETWASLYPRLDAAQRATAQRQMGEAAAHLHRLTFDGYGEVDGGGGVVEPRGPVAALAARAHRRLRTPRFRNVFLQVLEAHADLLDAAPGPGLCHEDLNPYNLLFELRDGAPVLSGVLDFESAWADTAGWPRTALRRATRARSPSICNWPCIAAAPDVCWPAPMRANNALHLRIGARAQQPAKRRAAEVPSSIRDMPVCCDALPGLMVGKDGVPARRDRCRGPSLEGSLYCRRQPLALFRFALFIARVKLGQHLSSKQLDGLADVLVSIAARLRDEDHLIHTGPLVAAPAGRRSVSVYQWRLATSRGFP